MGTVPRENRMRYRGPSTGSALFLAALILAAAPSADAGAAERSTAVLEREVAPAHDGAGFHYAQERLARQGRYDVYRLTYPSPVATAVEANNTVPADYYLPRGANGDGIRRPAVICLHIMGGNFELTELACSALAAAGIPALTFRLPYYGERGGELGRTAVAADPALFAEGLGQAMADVRRAVDLLASREEVDPERIGVMGISMGGILAASAAGAEPRVHRTAALLAGGDLSAIIGHSRETHRLREALDALPLEERGAVEAALERVDPLHHAAALRARAGAGRVLLINAAEDEVVPPAATGRLAQALGIADQVQWLDGLGHYSALAAMPEILETMVAFFAEDLPPEAVPPPLEAAPRSGWYLVGGLVQQLPAMLLADPPEGRCHLVDIGFDITLPDGEEHSGRVQVARGDRHRFRLEVEVTPFGHVAMGQGEYPWLLSLPGKVFRGTIDAPAAPLDPLAFVEPAHNMRLRMGAGVLAAAGIAPEVLDRWAELAEEPAASDGPAIVLRSRDEDFAGQVRLAFAADRRRPRSVDFDVAGVTGTAEFRVWQQNAPATDELFREPEAEDIQDVPADALTRIFSAMFNFLMETVE